MKPFLVAVLSLVALFAGSVALVLRWTNPPRLAAVAPATAPPDVAAPPAVAAGAPAPAVAVPAAPMPLADAERAPDPSAPPMADRVVRKSVRRALQAAPVQRRLAGCVDRDVGLGGAAAAPRLSRAPMAVLMLELEATPGEIKVVGARVDRWGGMSEEAVTCAWDALRGTVIAATSAGPSRRLRMPFPLSPRGEAMVAAR